MDNFAPAPCIPDDGIEARIPDSTFSVLTLIEARNRINANPVSTNRGELWSCPVQPAAIYQHRDTRRNPIAGRTVPMGKGAAR